MSQQGFLMPELLIQDVVQSSDDDVSEEAVPSIRWSFYAQNTFRRCQWEFMFGQIMANHHPTNPERREAFVLKQLQDLPTWRGSLVDYGIEKFIVPCLKSGQMPPLTDVVARTLAVAGRQWEFSAQKKYRAPSVTKSASGDVFCALYPHEYGLPVGNADLEQVKAEVRTAFETLYAQSGLIKTLLGHGWYAAKMCLPFRVSHASVKTELDLLFFRGNCQPTVIDWKAGHSAKSDYTWQMLVYALAVHRRWPDVLPEDIQVYEVNLVEGIIKSHLVTEERLTQAENYIYQSAMEIEALTGGRKFTQQNLENFEPANTPRTCAICNFRCLCSAVQARSENDFREGHYATCEPVWD